MMGMDGQLLLSPQQVVLGRHIEIRHYFIRDANEKKLIQVLKIHTDDNVADLLTKAFDGPRLIKSTHVAAVVPKSVAGSRILDGSSMLLTFDVQVQQGYEDCKLYGSKNED
ncbi:hypothetical protein Tco_0038930 [Tanacetum coccineum]